MSNKFSCKPMFVISLDFFVRADSQEEAETELMAMMKDCNAHHCPALHEGYNGDVPNQKGDEVRFELMGSEEFPLLTCSCGREYPPDRITDCSSGKRIPIDCGCGQCEDSLARERERFFGPNNEN